MRFLDVVGPYLDPDGALWDDLDAVGLAPSDFWQHPLHVAACLNCPLGSFPYHDIQLDFERKMQRAYTKLPGGTESWIGRSEVYRDACGTWRTRAADGSFVQAKPKRALRLYFV